MEESETWLYRITDLVNYMQNIDSLTPEYSEKYLKKKLLE